jgi:tRNA threonylcarbamoyladenosine biosynthesis protein TsaB
VIAIVIDASTYAGTVAVIDERRVLSEREAPMRGATSDHLMPAVLDALAEARLTVSNLDAVICGEGPGSFTSLRIAAGIAKGLCFGGAKPLYAVSSLALMLASVEEAPGRFLVTIDALRNEWYGGLLERFPDSSVTTIHPYIVGNREHLALLADEQNARLFGGMVGEARPHAKGAINLLGEIRARGPVDLDRWEPSYGRLAEAQVKWEAAHGRPLTA